MSTDVAEIDEPREVEFVSSTALGEITRAEIDTQIATAKKFPRSIGRAITVATTLATMTQEIAAACMYAIPRDRKMITGPSVRLAEIVASAWGNLRFGARVVGDDGRFLTVQGFAHDLEVNTAFAFELKARVTYKNGGRYSDDMIGVTANAASSKALRNAIFRVVPRAIVDQIAVSAKKVAAGDVKTLGVRRDAAVEHFKKMGVPVERLLNLCDKPTIADMDTDDLLNLLAIHNAIKTGETTVAAAFPEEQASRTEHLANKLPPVNGTKPKVEGERTPLQIHAALIEEAETVDQLEAAYKAAYADPAVGKADRVNLTRLRDERRAAINQAAPPDKVYGGNDQNIDNLK